MNEETNNEEWKTIPSFPDYEASTLGRVRRITPTARATRLKGEALRPAFDSRKRYLRHCLRRDSKQKSVCVHISVAEAFLGKKPGGYQVNHIDGCKTNNHLSNLEYVTQSQNQKHAVELGLHQPHKGSKHANAKLSEKDVDYILSQESVLSQREIARRLGVCFATVNHIIRGRLWSDYTGRKI